MKPPQPQGKHVPPQNIRGVDPGYSRGNLILNYNEDHGEELNSFSATPLAIPQFGTVSRHPKKQNFDQVSKTCSSSDQGARSQGYTNSKDSEKQGTSIFDTNLTKSQKTQDLSQLSKAFGFTRKKQPDAPWLGNRLSSLIGRFPGLTTDEIAEYLRQELHFIESKLGTRIVGLDGNNALIVPRPPSLPLPFEVKVGMAFWERVVEFSHEDGVEIGDVAAGTAEGKIIIKWRMHIVRVILGDREFLTTWTETHQERGLHTPYTPQSVRWQWLRVADARDENPENHSPHKYLKVDMTDSVDPRPLSDNSYVFAGNFFRCTLTENWSFAGYLDDESVGMLDILGQQVLQHQLQREHQSDSRGLIDWQAIKDGRHLRKLDTISPPSRERAHTDFQTRGYQTGDQGWFRNDERAPPLNGDRRAAGRYSSRDSRSPPRDSRIDRPSASGGQYFDRDNSVAQPPWRTGASTGATIVPRDGRRPDQHYMESRGARQHQEDHGSRGRSMSPQRVGNRRRTPMRDRWDYRARNLSPRPCSPLINAQNLQDDGGFLGTNQGGINGAEFNNMRGNARRENYAGVDPRDRERCERQGDERSRYREDPDREPRYDADDRYYNNRAGDARNDRVNYTRGYDA